MAEITKTLILSGEESLINYGLMAIAKQAGWKEGDEITVEQKALAAIKNFLRQQVAAYTIKEAQLAAQQAAAAQATASLDALTLTLE